MEVLTGYGHSRAGFLHVTQEGIAAGRLRAVMAAGMSQIPLI